MSLEVNPRSEKQSFNMNEETNKYIVFNQTLNSDTYTPRFIDEMRMFGEKGDSTCTLIAKILTSTKSARRQKAFNVHFWNSSELDENFILVIIHGSDDSVLIELAHECNFPRGFPVIWNVGKSVHFYGFYPKFENDSLREEIRTNEEFNNIASMNFNFKYSGYLGQVVPFVYIDKSNVKQYYYTTCGKNSTNYQFSFDLLRIIHKQMTKTLIKMLVDNNLHICGECMSKFDQNHGAQVLYESFVITMIAEGHKAILNSDKTISIHGTPSFNIETNKKIINYLPFQKTLEIAKAHDLNFDDTYSIINNEEDIVKEFLINLNNNRNFMTLHMFMDFMKTQPIGIIKGTINHEQVLGDVLEGIIIKIVYNDNSKKTIKYKFPYYTIRTFLLREITQTKEFNSSPKTKKNYDEYITSIKKIDEIKYFSDVTRYIKNWVVHDTNLSGRKFWGFVCSYLYNNFKEILDNYIDEYIRFLKSYRPEILPEKLQYILPFYGFHIFAIDYLMVKGILKYNKDYNYELETPIKQRELMFPIYQHTQTPAVKQNTILDIIFIFGSIGSGKTTIAQNIVKLNPLKYIHIDGDELELPKDRQAIYLKGERNGYTIWKIIEAIMKGKVPIVSIGGGVLLNIEADFRSYLNSITQNNNTINSLVIIPADITTITSYDFQEIYTHLDDIFVNHIYKLYHSQEMLEGIIKRRTWDKELIKTLMDINQNNYNIVLNNILKSKLKTTTKQLLLFPYIDNSNYGDVVDKATKINRIIDYVNPPVDFDKVNFSFKQKRLLAFYNISEPVYHHITIEYSDKIIVNINELDEFQKYKTKYLLSEIEAELCEYLINKKILAFIRVRLPIPDDTFTENFRKLINNINNFAHITVNQLFFPPKYMKDITIAMNNNETFANIFDNKNKEHQIIIRDIKKSRTNIIVENLFYCDS